MAILTFEICPYADSTGFKFKDTTGREPDNANGYPAGADLSLYVGTITWTGQGDTLFYSVSADVNDSGTFQLFNVVIPDGLYEVTYKVVDDQGADVGECTVVAMIDKDYSNNVSMLLAEANRCSKCRSSILKDLAAAKSYVDAAEILAAGQDIAGAHKAWAEGMRIIELQTCRC